MPAKKIFLVPLEPLKERYTEQWYRNFPPLFEQAGFKVTSIDGDTLEDEVKVGTFLDINSTCNYKSVQLQTIASLFHNKEVEQGSIFFFYDLEFWGIEQVRLLAQMNGVKIKIAGFMHAASYTKEDAFSIAAPYQQYTEVGWIAACDMVFVGSKYHKRTIINRRLKPIAGARWKELADKILVTKNPIFLTEYKLDGRIKKQKQIILSNRLDKEKRPYESLRLMQAVKRQDRELKLVLTTGRSTLRGTDQKAIDLALRMQRDGHLKIKFNCSKDEYHQELARSRFMITHSIEENYGYCIAEALIYDCIPIMRRGLAHNEFVAEHHNKDAYLFKNNSEAFTKLWAAINNPHLGVPYLDTYGASNIVAYINQLHFR